MTLGIIGATGWQGAGVAVRIAAAGHKALMGSRDPIRAARIAARLSQSLGLSAERLVGTTNAEAAAQGEMVFITVPMTAHRQILGEIKSAVEGKIVVDVTAPVNPQNQIENLWPPEGSATQEAQAVLSRAMVVGALKNISATALMNHRKAANCDVLVVGDDLSAKHRVMALLREMGLNGYDVGAGDVCRTVEGLTSMLIYLNYAYHLRQPGIKVAQIDPGLDFIPPEDFLT